jgi:hypothetical protein
MKYEIMKAIPTKTPVIPIFNPSEKSFGTKFNSINDRLNEIITIPHFNHDSLLNSNVDKSGNSRLSRNRLFSINFFQILALINSFMVMTIDPIQISTIAIIPKSLCILFLPSMQKFKTNETDRRK